MNKKLIVKFVSKLPNSRMAVGFNRNADLKTGDKLTANSTQTWKVTGQNFAKTPNSPVVYMLSGDGILEEGDEVFLSSYSGESLMA